MTFLLDESAEVRIASYLASLGHDVQIVQRDYAIGLPDDEVLRLATTEERVIITNDSDFGDLVFRDGLRHCGGLYVRFPLDSTATQKIGALESLLLTAPENLEQCVVLSPTGIRVRGGGA